MKTKSTLIWDLPTRLFHWLLVAGIVFMWYSAEVSDSLMEWHSTIGQALLVLMLFRIVWGFVGSDTARFSHFVRSPAAVLAYAKTVFSSKPSMHHGHNPLGGWMVVAIIVVVTLQAVTGLFASDDIMVEGPLYGLVSGDTSEKLTGLHHLLFNVLMLLIIMHVAAIVFYKYFKNSNLIPAIVFGSADLEERDVKVVRFKPLWLALVLLLVVAGVVYGGLMLV